MADRLSVLVDRFRAEPTRLLREELWPWLIWAAAPSDKSRDLVWGTVNAYPREPPAHDPLLFRLKKNELARSNAFAVGVTLGRTQNNDIPIDEPSVSRFHAFFQEDRKNHVWHVVDAESSNGTFLGEELLIPNRPAPIHDQSMLRFGNVELQFFLPTAFSQYLARRAAQKK